MQAAFKHGALAAILMSAWRLAEFALGLHTSRVGIGYYTSAGTDLILAIVLWHLLHQRAKRAGGTPPTLAENLLQGLLASLVAAMVFTVFVSLYLNFINPDYPDFMLEWKVAHSRAEGIPEEKIRAMARIYRWSVGPVGLPVMIFGRCLLVAALAPPLFTRMLNRWKPSPVNGP
ncbi:MAG TPA: DUF4199 domain-containing protein [Lacunisphaera sp.]|nr:DUF4199 domain-containing protein [Lacunisphaera sp.]